MFAEATKCLAHSVAGNAAADRENFACEGKDLLAESWGVKAFDQGIKPRRQLRAQPGSSRRQQAIRYYASTRE